MRLHAFARALPLAAVLLLSAYAALIRLDALVEKYGTVDHPRWAAVLTTGVAPLGRRLRPFATGWSRVPQPYEGGDPINYLRYAREMQSFYQAHVREPVFLALTRACLWLLDDQDIALSFASALGSVLLVAGTWLVAASFLSRPSALAVALLMAVEYDVVTWSVDGWRDDTFAATVLWVTWACLRVRRDPSTRNMLLLGVLAGISCLTRITALSFVVPALVWLVLDARRAERPRRARGTAIAAAAATVLVAPYLVSCAIATGDPFLSINYHTVYYRAGEGLPTAGDVSAAAYIGGKFTRHPVATLDTGLNGIFVQPFVTKWNGLPPPVGRLRPLVMIAGAVGLLLLPFTPAGRLLLVVLFTSLLPYAFTWNVGGGDAWRFTMHAYPFYAIACFHAIDRVIAAARTIWRSHRAMPGRPPGATVLAGAAVAACVVALACAFVLLPWFVVREALAHREDVSIETGRRDWMFYRTGWSAPHDDGVIVRVSRADRSLVRLPLPRGSAYEIVLRLDPLVPEVQQRLAVLFNRELVARFRLAWDPARMGTYRFRVQPAQIRAWSNELAVVPETLVPAASAGPRFGWLEPDERVGVRLWYVRILPVE
jgi:4-amino-4-deoxy-L-arabinose transferase-like glycosyltransferase